MTIDDKLLNRLVKDVQSLRENLTVNPVELPHKGLRIVALNNPVDKDIRHFKKKVNEIQENLKSRFNTTLACKFKKVI